MASETGGLPHQPPFTVSEPQSCAWCCIETLAHPNTNATGFLQFEYSLSAKWLELLRELKPRVKRVGILRDPGNAAGIGQWAVIQAAAQPLNVELSTVDLRGPQRH